MDCCYDGHESGQQSWISWSEGTHVARESAYFITFLINEYQSWCIIFIKALETYASDQHKPK